MKRLLFLGVGSALMFTMGGVGPAQADNVNSPHVSTLQGTGGVSIAAAGATRCAGCHRAHTATGEYLLKDAQPGLCYTCHGGGATGAATNVKAGQTPGGGALRGGGFETAAIGTGSAFKEIGADGKAVESSKLIPAVANPVTTTSKHLIDGTAGQAWGNGALNTGVGKSVTLECGSCHDPHGNGNYRILRPIPVDSGAGAPRIIRPARAAKDAVLNADGSVKTPAIPAVSEVLSADKAGVVIPDAVAKVYTTTNYWLAGDVNVGADTKALYTGELNNAKGGGSGVTGGSGGDAPDGYIANVANWCTTCHTRYLATNKSYQTPSGDAQFMYRHRSDANYKAGAANCITCHVSHGSNAQMSGYSADVAMPGTSAGSADSRLLRVDNRGTCLMCHNV